MSIRTLALPALAASTLLALCACDPTTPAAPPADPTAAAAQAAPAPTATGLPDTPAPTGIPKVTLVTPTAGGPTADPTASGTPKAVLASPSPSGQPVVAGTPDLKLASYDQQTGKAVLTAADAVEGTPSPTATATATAAVRTGQLIDSPPSAAAPRGALLAITDVQPAADGKVAVSTRPATISELLGRTWADIRTALDPHNIKVTPQLKDLKASYVPNPDGAKGSASAALKLDANTTVPLPGGASAKLSGSLELDPTVDFTYQGGLLSLQQAKVGFDLGAHANWHVTAGLTASTGPVKIPIAKLTATPVVMVGPVPVVITLDLTVYAEVSADGTITVDTEQNLAGNWGIHANYTKAGGWTSATDPGATTVSPVKATFSGNANVRTGLVADGSVALYDTLGVKATVEPYLRAAVEGTVSVDTSGAKPTVDGKAGLYGGLDVNGAVMARIAILGTPLLEKDLPFPIYKHEWPIVTREIGNASASAKSGTSSNN
ncbi:hypothetical protein [Kitasatospora sp. GP82]|uniref:hypothetical protein n=1 Tax=Kitasatospora sp. GP82 TaxID=3035089 RepID=UPI002473C2BB|nr:hypothetical protein [Kitasatospora sp. GP82]MDH6126758.1 hypothetical protein [Kitasatospora sp. GP82]